MKKHCIFPTAIALSLCFFGGVAHAAKLPTPLMTDNRVKQVPYDPNQVYELVGSYNYQTSIEFEADEMVKVVALGDTIAWQTIPFRNRVFIKPVEDNADTNMTIITSKRTYYFQLSSTKKRTGQSYLVRFIYPSSRLSSFTEVKSPEPAPVVSTGTPVSPNINRVTRTPLACSRSWTMDSSPSSCSRKGPTCRSSIACCPMALRPWSTSAVRVITWS